MQQASSFDFDTVVERRVSDSLKWGRYKGRDIIPLWVADMDFRSPPAVIEALKARADHGVLGYGRPPEKLAELVIERLARLYRWNIDRSWLVWIPGLVVGLNLACRAVGQRGDAALSLTPVYPPFLSAPELSERRLITVPLAMRDDHYGIDFEQLARAITTDTKLLLLCNPHNPVGRIFTKTELDALAELAERHDLIVCSDEIHCDLILDAGLSHIPFASLSSKISMRTITLMAPSKTFNIPGLGCSIAIIEDQELRRRFRRVMDGIVPDVNIFGFEAALAAYEHGGAWLAELLPYLRENRALVERAIGRIDKLSMSHVEATYLAWIDMRKSGVDDPIPFLENAGLGLSDGKVFGAEGFVRLNFGCPRATLDEALRRLNLAFNLHAANR